MANLGNIGHTVCYPPANLGAWGPFGIDKRSTSVTMTFTSDIPNAFAVLTRNSVVNGRTRCNGSGVGHFYDMDDSGGQVYGIATFTQSGPTGEAWTATVAGSTVVVTKIFSANRATAIAFA